MKNPGWEDTSYRSDMASRERRESRQLDVRAQVAKDLRKRGYELDEEVDIVLHANESHAVRVVVGRVLKKLKTGEKFFLKAGEEKPEPYNRVLVETFQRERLSALDP